MKIEDQFQINPRRLAQSLGHQCASVCMLRHESFLSVERQVSIPKRRFVSHLQSSHANFYKNLHGVGDTKRCACAKLTTCRHTLEHQHGHLQPIEFLPDDPAHQADATRCADTPAGRQHREPASAIRTSATGSSGAIGFCNSHHGALRQRLCLRTAQDGWSPSFGKPVAH